MDPNTDSNETEKQEDEKKVPLAALEDERRKRHSLETQLAELRGQVTALSARPSDPPREEKTLSAAELRQAVDEGKISEAEADAIRERQIEARLTKRLESEFGKKLDGVKVSETVGAQIRRYKEAIPELEDRESEQFAKVSAQFQYLVNDLGYDKDDPRTELLAAQAAFGDPSKLKKIDPKPPRTHEETGGGGGGVDERTKDGAPKGLTPRLREFYRGRIEKGMYSGWDDPALKKEMGFVNEGVAKRAQERAA